MDFNKTFEELSIKRKTQLYSYPICVNNYEVVPPPSNYEARVNATYECKNFGSCSQVGLDNEYCSTTTCNHNRECFSNNCVNGTCMTNDSNPTYNCRTSSNNGDYKIKCALLREEKCKSDSECGEEEKCYHNICAKSEYQKSFNYKWLLLIVLIVLVILCILGCVFRNKKH